MKKISFSIFFAILTTLLTSCAYHFGTPGTHHGIAIDAVKNRTQEPQASIELKNRLHEQFKTSVGLSGKKQNEYLLQTEILELKNFGQARAEVRDKKSRDDDGDAYQTVLYRIELVVKFRLVPSNEGGDRKPLCEGTVKGIANLPLMHDREVALKNAMKQAAHDAARKIADQVADLD